MNALLDVLHELELGPGSVDLDVGGRVQFVDQSAEDLAVTKGILVRLLELLSDHGLDPLLGFAFLSSIALGSNLQS